LAITPGRRYTADEKATIMATIARAQQLCPARRLTAILADLGLSSATFYRWQARAQRQQLADRVVTPSRPAVPPTPQEIACVVQGAQRHLLLGYKRLAYALMAENQAFLRPWMVHDILDHHQLLGRRAPLPPPLVRPPAADHPDQRWHTDLTMWWFDDQWFWMIDVLDAYSRYLVHCELLLTAKTDAVERAVQRALDTLAARPRRAGEPQLVHDGGPQFIGHDWVQFMQAVGATNVRTHPYHPQSNGLDERVHRTFREELPIESEAVLYEARALMLDYRDYYNNRRPHSALKYLCPVDYYRGDPAARLAEREAKLRAAAVARAAYWQHERDRAADSLS
jgi:transposase InsO family protein